MQLTVNGEPRSFDRPLTVAEFVSTLGLGAERVAIELNRAVVPRRDHATTALREGDVLEVVTFVGGG
ncbi:MAG: sulfur carrier protein ThiS [Deltaproteobacteria bacterium]|nr:sulfur carrier protein ThiS [Deltaproteobacteria bacterium]